MTSRTTEPLPAPPESQPDSEETLGALVHRMTQQVPELVRSEIRLAQAELTQKGKQAGIGLGMFSVAGLLAFFGLALLLTTAVLALALAVAAWLAALIVAVAVLLTAGVAAMVGRSRVQEATPPQPERAIEGVKEDVATIKGERGAP